MTIIRIAGKTQLVQDGVRIDESVQRITGRDLMEQGFVRRHKQELRDRQYKMAKGV